LRFNGGINLFFHRGVVLVPILIFPVAKVYFGGGTPLLVRDAKNCQDFFLTIFEALTEGNEGNKEEFYFDVQNWIFVSFVSFCKNLGVGQENQQKETKVTKGFSNQLQPLFSSPARESVRSCLL
jgi:hypothetical protein